MQGFIRKLSLLLVSTGLFVGCSSLQITNPSKQMVRPGLPTQTSVISYSFSVAPSEEIKIVSISLLRKATPTAITNFVLVDLADGKLLKPEAALSIGSYNVSFQTAAANVNINESETIELVYNASGKKKTTVIIPELKADLLMK